jgi:ubiquinone/menaquinone biosynthesis C-methylase UbiE
VVTAAELASIAGRIPDLTGWDFSSLEAVETPPPWRFSEVVRRYLDGNQWVADIGTGGGEAFLNLAPDFARGIGIDHSPNRLREATKLATERDVRNVSFVRTSGTMLPCPDRSLDVVLARYADYAPTEVTRVLRPGGIFATMQMGDSDTANIFETFGWGTYGAYWRARFQSEGRYYMPTSETAQRFASLSCEVLTFQQYNLPLYFKDVESLVFYLKASPLPEEIDPNKHWRPISRLVEQHTTDLGIRTNQHRELLVVRAPA